MSDRKTGTPHRGDPLIVVMVGELTLDELVFEASGRVAVQPGGGALYSAIGSLYWGARPILNASLGIDFPRDLLQTLEDHGVSLRGITPLPNNGVRLRLVHEQTGARHQVPKPIGVSLKEADEARLSWASLNDRVDGVHLAPQTTMGQLRALQDARERSLPCTMDVMVEPYIDLEPYRLGSPLEGVTALIPTESEAEQIWGRHDPADLFRWLNERAEIPYLVLKRGVAGATLVWEEGIAEIPAYPTRAVDATGAGDAFCGGFLTGIVETGDPLEASLRGTVSSSFVVECEGPREILQAMQDADPDERMGRVRSMLRVAS